MKDLCYANYQRYLDCGDLDRALLLLNEEPDLLKERLGEFRYWNDQSVLQAIRGNVEQFEAARESARCVTPRHALVRENMACWQSIRVDSKSTRSRRIAIVSLLFNWPSTGGGTVHTAELALFLDRAGYDVRHFCVRYAPWNVGQVEDPPTPVESLEFTDEQWNANSIQDRVRSAVDLFSPDFVIVTSSWNFKPLLAEAVKGYPFLLRFAALECLCPLNNIRLLVEDHGRAINCPNHQLADAETCVSCVAQNARFSGGLHQAERALSGFGTAEYEEKLRWAVRTAEAVFVVNPLIAGMFAPYAKRVEVVPSGFDPARFPQEQCRHHAPQSVSRILFAGLSNEFMKGFHILRAAVDQLWQTRQDFRVVITGDRPERPEPWSDYVGWQSQNELPELMASCDMLVFPTVAEEALGRSAVEALACGLPVIASRIGGLQFVVADEARGLLFSPGNVEELLRKLNRLLDDPDLRAELGRLGRKYFEAEFLWEDIIERKYRPVLGPPVLAEESAR